MVDLMKALEESVAAAKAAAKAAREQRARAGTKGTHSVRVQVDEAEDLGGNDG